MTIVETPDPTGLSLSELREHRRQLQEEDDAVAYARRVAQVRLDLVRQEIERRSDPSPAAAGPDVGSGLLSVLSQQLTTGPARPPRPTIDLSDHQLAVELDDLCARNGSGRLQSLDDDQLAALAAAIAEFEARVSSERQVRFERLDLLSAELVRRYRDGEADVDSLNSG